MEHNHLLVSGALAAACAALGPEYSVQALDYASGFEIARSGMSYGLVSYREIALALKSPDPAAAVAHAIQNPSMKRFVCSKCSQRYFAPFEGCFKCLSA